MLIDLSSENILQFVNQYQEYRSRHEARGLDIVTFCNGELEVDEYLSENMHLVWYGQFYQRFPSNWQLIPERPNSAEAQQSLQLREKAKVRYVCQKCGHTWTSMNGYIYFWAASDFRVFFDLPGAACSLCHCASQPALWYPDEAIRVIDNLFGYLTAGYQGRQKMENTVYYRRGIGFNSKRRTHISTSSPGSEAFTDYASSICSSDEGMQQLKISISEEDDHDQQLQDVLHHKNIHLLQSSEQISKRRLSTTSIDSGVSYTEMPVH